MTATSANWPARIYSAFARWWGDWRTARRAADQLAKDYLDPPSEPASAAGRQQVVQGRKFSTDLTPEESSADRIA